MKLIDFLNENVQSKIALLTRKFPEESKEKIETVAKYFDKMGLDVNKFKTFNEMFVKTQEKSKSEIKKEVRISGSDKVFENDEVVIVRPKTYDACILYGSNTKWCITQKEHWNDYNKRFINFYFLIAKKEIEEQYKKIAVAVYSDGRQEWFDTIDNKMDINKIENILKKYKINKSMFKPFDFNKIPIKEKCEMLKLKNYKINSDGTVDVDGDVDISFKLSTWIIKFGSIQGNFNCWGNNLTTLEGAPENVGGNFNCGDNNLTTLEGAPKSVGGNFNCWGNKLITLEGAPKKIGGNFYCWSNKLTTLKGAPENVGGGFDCSGNELTTLEGAPKKVGRNFNCSNNRLVILEGAPESVGGNFNCWGNNLSTLEGVPKNVGGDFNCWRNNLTTLEGAPENVGGDFDCSHNNLITLEGAPKNIKGDFNCRENKHKFNRTDLKSNLKGKFYG